MSSVPERRRELVSAEIRSDGCCRMRRWPSRSRALALCGIEPALSPSGPLYKLTVRACQARFEDISWSPREISPSTERFRTSEEEEARIATISCETDGCGRPVADGHPDVLRDLRSLHFGI